MCENSCDDGGGCGNCRTVPISRKTRDSGYDSGSSNEGFADLEISRDMNNHSPAPQISHVEKFLCPRFAKYSDAPSDGDVFTGPSTVEGEVEIESCGWERQIFVDRKPE